MLCVLVACGKEDSSNKGSKDGDKINVSTTVYPLQSFIKQIGGNHVNVSSIYPLAQTYMIMNQLRKTC